MIEALERWVQNGERLNQTVANQIRQSIATAITERIDWSAERAIKSPIKAKQISIPNALGEGNLDSDPIKVADDHSDSTGQLRSELAAVVRLIHLNGGKVNYVGSDDDLVRIGNLTDRLMPQALALVRASIRQKLGMAVRLLSTNSRILGLIERYRTPASLAAFLFGSRNISVRPPGSAPAEFAEWRALQEQALRIRPDLIQFVASYCGSFQGAGRTSYAIDMVRVTDCLLPEGDTTNLNSLDLGSTELKQALAMMSEARVKAQARKVLQGASNIRTRLVAELGENFDKQEVAEEFRALAEQLRASGVWNSDEIGIAHPAFKSLCEDFRSAALREALSMLASSVEGDEGQSDDQLVSRMGRFDIHPLIVASRFAEAARKVVRASDKRASGLEVQFQGVDPQEQTSEILSLFESLANEIDSLVVEGETACS
ncbi:hypothetical protein I4984_22280 [Pseudomonas aeruginosa]|nr:hypothetical protein [Pseudomonas aeruginosa]HEJ6505262.1 hypothetical protein [Pseudomonas aeruginosa]